jgi:hypothetical protein
MSHKQIVENLRHRVSKGVCRQEIVREIEFVDAVRKGFAELDRRGGIPIEDVERELPSWIIQ